MEQTRYEHLTASDQERGHPAPPLEKAVPQDACIIPLPQPSDIKVRALDLRTAIEQRRSVRRYARDPLTIEELAFLCWCTQGIVDVKTPFYTLRTVPSAGGRHALETWLLINRSKVYHPGCTVTSLFPIVLPPSTQPVVWPIQYCRHVSVRPLYGEDYAFFERHSDPALRTMQPVLHSSLAARKDTFDQIRRTGTRVLLSGFGGDAVLAGSSTRFRDLLLSGRIIKFLVEAGRHIGSAGTLRGMGLRSAFVSKKSRISRQPSL